MTGVILASNVMTRGFTDAVFFMHKLRLLSASRPIPESAIQEFQVLYQKHYGIVLPQHEANVKLTAFLGLLAAAREGAGANCAAPDAGGGCSGHCKVTQ